MSDLQHGMVLVSRQSMLVPTCLCGWVGAGLTQATAFGEGRRTWQGHVELEERLARPVDVAVGEEER